MELISVINWEIFIASVGSVLWLVLKAVAVLVVGFFLTKWVLGMTHGLLKKSKLSVTLHTFVISCLKIICYVFLIVTALTMLNVPTASLITAIGTAGVAVGLALKDSLSNFASGVLILANAPFKAGDFVDINGETGIVYEIGLMNTKLTTLDNRRVMLPNNTVTNGKITNFNAEPTRRLDMNFSIGYECDAKLAVSLIHDIIRTKQVVLNTPAEPFVKVTEYQASGVNITLRCWVKAEDLWPLNFELLEEVRDVFDANHITIPYPQMDVHVKTSK